MATLLWIMLVRPLKAPEKMKRMLVVSTSMVFFPEPLRSGTLMTAPSIIFNRLCCTPSPPTSRWNWPPFFELILSTSSKKIIPRKQNSFSCRCEIDFVCSQRILQFSHCLLTDVNVYSKHCLIWHLPVQSL